MKEIPLLDKNGVVVAHALVDDADHNFLNQWVWRYHSGYAVRKIKGSTVHMHRLIADTPDNMVCDHINGSGIDNQRSNLRNCTNKENQRNRTQNIGKSQYKGVYFEKRQGKWRADIRVDYKLRFLGYHPCELDAARAYDHAARLHFGEFARLNFPQESE